MNGHPLINDLIDRGLLHDCVYSQYRRSDQWDRFAARLGGTQRPKEPDATALLTFLHGDLEQAVVRAWCGAAGIEHRSSFRILSGAEYNRDTKAGTRRSIDIVVVDSAGDDGAVKAHAERDAVIAVEAKFGAAVNGDKDYCLNRPGGYSDQTICYIDQCMMPRLDPRDVAFLWMTEHGTGFGRGALHAAEPVGTLGAEAWPVHTRLAADLGDRWWKHCSWDIVYDAVADHLGDAVDARMILSGLGVGDVEAR